MLLHTGTGTVFDKIQALYLNLSLHTMVTGRGHCLRVQQHCEDDAQDSHGQSCFSDLEYFVKLMSKNSISGLHYPPK
jgi:hypothetical protein